MSIDESVYLKMNHRTDKKEYENNLENVTLNYYMQKFKVSIIESLKDKSIDEMINYYKENKDKRNSLIIINGARRGMNSDFELEAKDFYEKYFVPKSIEDKFLNGDSKGFDDTDRFLLENNKSEIISLLSEVANIHKDATNEMSNRMNERISKYETSQEFYEKDFKFNMKNYQNEYDELLDKNLFELNDKLNNLMDLIDLEDDNSKKLLIGEINKIQKNITNSLVIANNGTLHNSALHVGKKTQFGKPDMEVVLEHKSKLLEEVYKSIAIYNPNKIGIYGQNSFTTLLKKKLDANASLMINKFYDEKEKEHKEVTLKDSEGNSKDVRELTDTNDSEEFFTHLIKTMENEESLIKMVEKRNIVRNLLDSKRDLNGNEKDILRNLIYSYDELKERDSLMEEVGYIEFLKAAIHVENQVERLNSGLNAKEGLDVDKEWVSTYKKYKLERLSTIGSMSKDAQIFLDVANKQDIKFSKSLHNPVKKIVKMVETHLRDDVVSTDEEGNLKYPKHHQDCLNKILDFDINNVEKAIEKDIDSRSVDIEKLIEVSNKPYESKLLTKPYEEAEKELKKESITENSMLLKFKEKIVNPFLLKKVNSLKEEFKDSKQIEVIPNMSEKQYIGLKSSIAAKTSNGAYDFDKNLTFGKYGFDIKTLTKFNILDKDKLSEEFAKTGVDLDGYDKIYRDFVNNPENWNKKYCGSLEEFLGNKKLQEELIDVKLCDDYKTLNTMVKEDKSSKIKDLDNLRPWEVSGVLLASHTIDLKDTKEVLINGNDNILSKAIIDNYSLGRNASLEDIENTLQKLEKYNQHKNINFRDNSKDFSSSEIMFNPMAQMEYFSKELGDLINALIIVHNNIKNEEFTKLKSEYDEGRKTSQLDKLIEKEFQSNGNKQSQNKKAKHK